MVLDPSLMVHKPGNAENTAAALGAEARKGSLQDSGNPARPIGLVHLGRLPCDQPVLGRGDERAIQVL